MCPPLPAGLGAYRHELHLTLLPSAIKQVAFVCTDLCLGYGYCKELAVKLLIHKFVVVTRYFLTLRTAQCSL